MNSYLPPDEVTQFRAIRRTAVVVLLFFRLDRPLGETDIAEIIDIHPSTARSYLRSLSRLGIISRSNRYSGYILTDKGRQLFLFSSDLLEEPTAEKPRSSAKISRSPLLIESTIINDDPDDTDLKVIIEEESAKNSRSPELLEALAQEEIQENDHTRPLFDSNLTPDHVLGYALKLKDKKQDDYKPGLLITVLLNIPSNDIPPKIRKSTGHLYSCHCQECGIEGAREWGESERENQRRYATGESTDSIDS